MYFTYSLLLTLAFLILLPRFVLDAIRHGKYAAGFWQRTGAVPRVEFDAARPVVWVHCVSVGETMAARPVVAELLARHPHFRIVVSTTTLTGQRTAQAQFGDITTLIIYFPFDWAWSVRRALRRINPGVVLIMETELWANFLRECHRRAIPVALVNGRLSSGSMRGYGRIRFFMRRVVNDLSVAVMQSDADAGRIASLGLDASLVKIAGNVKFDVTENVSDARDLCERFRLEAARPLIVAASTHHTEEQIMLAAFSSLLNDSLLSPTARPRLIIAPRHPERFAEVAALIQKHTASYSRRSAAPLPNDATSDIILLDSIGELAEVYRHAEIVFVGGSIAPRGGHNILEPAAAGACVITGAHTANFAHITQEFREADAFIQLPASVSDADATQSLLAAMRDLLNYEPHRAQLISNAHHVITRNRGATSRTLDFIAPLFMVDGDKGKGARTKDE
ncbi:MAG: 3-deoxy-D-manno-octulosonic acid transferase [Pyrinomonadaceae bacterium MAG19_C2-C3]|nr:3-deoxy-D-manno-octulosonic acid transferase [Pyrinomonadaceae bacterium MAG19_C2-C3]